MKICMIAALAQNNNVIGNEGKIPWHIKEDFQLFKEKTLNCPIIMGRLTWDSLPKKPLPNRENIIISSTPNPNYPNHAKNLNEAIEIAKQFNSTIWLIGGQRIYTQGLEICDELHLSFVKGDFKGDTFFPKIPNHFIEDESKTIKFDKFTFKLLKNVNN